MTLITELSLLPSHIASFVHVLIAQSLICRQLWIRLPVFLVQPELYILYTETVNLKNVFVGKKENFLKQ